MRVQDVVSGPWAVLLGREIAEVFAIERWQVLNGMVRFHGRLLVSPEAAMQVIVPRLESYGYLPVLHRPDEITLVRLARHDMPGRADWKGWPLNAGLFAATVATTVLVGADFQVTDPGRLLAGVMFSASLLLILGAHEFGHYLTARAYGVHVSLPYFVPLPVWPMGTMGAIIRMQSPIPSRRVLFDIGIAGPLAGLVVGIPLLVLGLWVSPVQPLHGVVLQEGNSLAYLALKWLLKGAIPEGADVLLHPTAMAGWLGLFVTALNLMPLSQLDGGHIAYAILGGRFRWAVWGFLGVLVLLFAYSEWYGWLIWVAVSVVLGLRHPAPLDDVTPLDPGRRLLAGAAAILLVVLLPPLPLAIYEY
jgi:membrane-associated protease RseP (regulator of RpoE activity)